MKLSMDFKIKGLLISTLFFVLLSGFSQFNASYSETDMVGLYLNPSSYDFEYNLHTVYRNEYPRYSPSINRMYLDLFKKINHFYLGFTSNSVIYRYSHNYDLGVLLAYRLELSSKLYLICGIKPQLLFHSVSNNYGTSPDQSRTGTVGFDTDAGLTLGNANHWSLGFSRTNIIEPTLIYSNNNQEPIYFLNHINYLLCKELFSKDVLYLSGETTFRNKRFNDFYYYLSLRMEFKNKLQLGAGYKKGNLNTVLYANAIPLLIGYRGDYIVIRYIYDFQINGFNKNSGGMHEFSLGLNITK